MAEKQYEIRTVKTVRLSVMQADQINGSTPLEILDFGLALASRQGLPVLKRTKRCVFYKYLQIRPGAIYLLSRTVLK